MHWSVWKNIILNWKQNCIQVLTFIHFIEGGQSTVNLFLTYLSHHGTIWPHRQSTGNKDIYLWTVPPQHKNVFVYVWHETGSGIVLPGLVHNICKFRFSSREPTKPEVYRWSRKLQTLGRAMSQVQYFAGVEGYVMLYSMFQRTNFNSVHKFLTLNKRGSFCR